MNNLSIKWRYKEGRLLSYTPMAFIRRVFLVLLLTFSINSCGIVLVEDIADDVIELLAPVDNAAISDNTITLWWEPIDDVDHYRIQVAQPDFENTIILKEDTTTRGNKISLTLGSGMYAWRVRGENSAYETNYSTRNFSIDTTIDISLSQINVIVPNVDFASNTERVQFTWDDLSGANEYQLEIAQPDFNVPFTMVVDESTTLTSYLFNGNESEYAWRLIATNSISASIPVEGVFRIDLTAPDAPTLLTPDDGDTLTTNEINFKWQLVTDAILYEISIMKDVSLLDTVLLVETINTESIVMDLDTVSYYWNVRALDEAGNKSTITETRKFTQQ